MGISVEVNAQPTLQGLGIFASGLANTATINRKVGIQLYGWTLRNFQSQGGLLGTPWPPLAPSTVRQKARLGFSPQALVRTGNLRQSFAPFSTADYAGVGAKASAGVDYAEVHQTGSQKRPGRPPARPMLPPDEVALDITVQVYGLEIAQLRQTAGL